MSKKIACSLALAAGLTGLSAGCATTTKPAGMQQPSLLEKMTQSVKSGTASMVAAVTPKKTVTSTVTPPPSGKPGPGVFVAMAEVSLQSDALDDAEAQYKKALDLDPNHLGALIGYAHLEDRRHNFEGALKLYQRALKKHSRDASVHNDLGLCYMHRDMLPEAAKSMQRAVELNGDRKLYRNNLATVYVAQGKSKEALRELTFAHGEAVGHYNLGVLLTQKNDRSTALYHFQLALEKDPKLAAAQEWIAQLQAPKSEVQTTQLAIVETAQRPAKPNSPVTTTARFTVDPAAATAGSSEVVLRAGATGSQPQTPAATVVAPTESSSNQAPSARWPNSLRETSNSSQSGNGRLPGVEPSRG